MHLKCFRESNVDINAETFGDENENGVLLEHSNDMLVVVSAKEVSFLYMFIFVFTNTQQNTQDLKFSDIPRFRENRKFISVCNKR